MHKFGQEMWQVFKAITDPAHEESFDEIVKTQESVLSFCWEKMGKNYYPYQAGVLRQYLLQYKKARDEGGLKDQQKIDDDFERRIKSYQGQPLIFKTLRDNYTAYIAANKYTQAFDQITESTAKKAAYRIKRRNKEWRDCTIWIESGPDKKTIHDGGL